ncbi:MAG: Ig-like domain-containing protein, partial [Gemmatimonadales bacterium]
MTLRPLLRNLMLAALVAGSVTCSGDKLSLPDEQRPSKITIMRGDNQSATVGQPVDDSLIVRVTDSKDRPVVDQPVRFTVGTNGGGAVLIPDSVVTDADGQARARWVLGTTAGTQTAVAQAVGFTLSATFSATAAAAQADTIFLVRGNNQAANVNAALRDSLVVRVTDAYRNPVSGIAVSWSASGGGTVSATSVLTGTDGQAAVERILGPQAGVQGASASAVGLKGSPVGFSHTALAGGPAALVVVDGDNQPPTPAGLALPQSLVVKVVDGAGNGIAGIAVGFAPDSGGTASPTPVTTDAGGLARSSWTLGPKAGPQTLTASAAGFFVKFHATATSDVPTRLQLSAGNNQTDTVGTAVATAPAVRVLDANSNPVAGVGVTFTVTGGGGTVTGPSGSGVSTVVATGANGIATLTSWVLGTTAGGNTMAASASGVSGPLQGSPVNFSATGVAGAEARLGILTQPPSTAASDAILSPAPVVRLEDTFGNPVGKSGVAVSVSLSGGGTLRGTATRSTNAQGQATFSGLSIQGLVGSYTLNFSASGLTGVSSGSITLTPGAAAMLGITTQPSTSAQSGVVFPIQPVIQVQDSAGNPVAQAGVNVTASIATGGGTLNGTVTLASNAQGSVGYTTLAISGTSGPRTLLFSAAGLSPATSNPVTIGAGGGSKLAFIQQPANGTAGAALAPAVTVAVQDANGNTVTSSTASVTLALGANPGGATLGGTLTVSAVNGIATFSTLTLNRTGQGYTLAASSSGLTGTTSSGFDISPAAAAGLVFSVQPTSAVAGAVIVPPIQVTVQDAFGNTVTTATTAVTLAVGTNPSGGALSGTKTVNAVAGVATFNDLSIDKAGNGYTLTADDGAGGLPLVSSAGFNISVGSGNRLAFVVQPGNTTAGAAISPAVQVAVQDGSGNTVTGATDAITLAIGNNAGGGTLSGTLTVNAVNGIATFGNLSINRSGTGYTLNATAGGLASAT